jgi:hypothetical protein
MRLPLRVLLSGCLALAAAAAQGQAAPAAPAATAAQDLPTACAASPADPKEAAAQALRAQCLLAGLVRSTQPFTEARQLAREAMRQGDANGGLLLYVAYSTDPANTFVRDGKPDLATYRRLAARSLDERRDQIEAIDALGYAAGKGNAQATLMLARYFQDTIAPLNTSRVREATGLLMRTGMRSELNDRMLREASAINDAAPRTKASVRAFLDAYRPATAAALKGHAVQTKGVSCEQATLQSVSSGDIRGEQYLPLKEPLVANTFLVKGSWTEFWLFSACGEDVPVQVTFEADGNGGARHAAVHNTGS